MNLRPPGYEYRLWGFAKSCISSQRFFFCRNYHAIAFNSAHNDNKLYGFCIMAFQIALSVFGGQSRYSPAPVTPRHPRIIDWKAEQQDLCLPIQWLKVFSYCFVSRSTYILCSASGIFSAAIAFSTDTPIVSMRFLMEESTPSVIPSTRPSARPSSIAS